MAQNVLHVLGTYKTKVLEMFLWVYPPMFDEIVTKEMVKPTDWALTSQKLTKRPHVFDRGR